MEQVTNDLDQRLAVLTAEGEQKWAAHHRIVNAQPRSQQARIDAENRDRIMRWADRRCAELGIPALMAALDAHIAAAEQELQAPAADTPAPEASAPAVVVAPATEAVVVPVVQPGTKAKG